jgi:hypothetical protein
MNNYRITKHDRQTNKPVCVQQVRAISVQSARESFAAKSGCTLETLLKKAYLCVEGVQ